MIDLFYFGGLPVAVLGLARSGAVAARALQAAGAEVWAWDDDPQTREKAEAQGIPIVDLAHCDWRELTSLVISPGIPHRYPAPHPLATRAREAGCEIIGDIELLARAQRDARYIGITGTNGKSTTTALIGHIFELSGSEVAIGGNLGVPALSLEALGEGGTYVLEMSSYQLEITMSVTFDVAVLLNISEDHLDRHGGLQGYIDAKKQIFRRQTSPRSAVIGVDDPHCQAIHQALVAAGDQKIIAVSGQREVPGGVYVVEGVLYDDMEGQKVPAAPLHDVSSLPGQHNWQNAAAAYAACKAAGLQPPVISACIRSFPGLRHRQELVAVKDGVAYVNDSKATNAEAAARALSSYREIYWIAGGRAKEGGLSALDPYLANLNAAYLIGEAAQAFAEELGSKLPVHSCGHLEAALAQASHQARQDLAQGLVKHPVVLLSPACASFDQFTSFEARGDSFRDQVEALDGEESDSDDWSQRSEVMQ